jgi:hypothetical protein
VHHVRAAAVLALAAVPLLDAALTAQAPVITAPQLQRTRAVWFVQTDNPVGAEVALRWEALPWTDSTAKAWDGPAGTRLPLGENAWAMLETFTELVFGKVAVKAGAHCVVLDKDKNGWRLALLDADKVRAAQLAPGVGKGVAPTAAIALTAAGNGDDGPLRAEWEPAKGGGRATLVLRWGTHVLRADAVVQGSDGASPIALPDPRHGSRIALAANGSKAPGAVIDHGVVAWSDERAGDAGGMKPGTRWRLGKDWATTLDTNVPLTLGGKKLAAGCWHLVLARTADGWNLVVSSAAADLAAKLDGFAAQHVQPVLEVPLQRAPQTPPANELAVRFAADGAGGAGSATRLEVAFGPERWSAPVTPGK